MIWKFLTLAQHGVLRKKEELENSMTFADKWDKMLFSWIGLQR